MHIFNNPELFISGRQSPLAGMCFVRRLPQECCSNGRQFGDGRRKLCLTDAIIESGKIEVNLFRSFRDLASFQFLCPRVDLFMFSILLWSTASFSSSVK